MKRLFPFVFLALSACVATPYGVVVAPVPATVTLTAAVRPHIHAIVLLPGDQLQVSYIPGTVTELQIVASLQSYCTDRGLTAYRIPGPTIRRVIRNRRALPRTVLVFNVGCR